MGDDIPTYQVIYSANIAAIIKHPAKIASDKGIRESFVASLEEIYKRLRNRPLDFGEYCFGSDNVSCQIGAIRPVAVHFAIHTKLGFVLLRKVSLMEA